MSLSDPPPPSPNPTTPASAARSSSTSASLDIVPLLPSTAYLSFRGWPKLETASCVHGCDIHHPQAGRLRFFAKIYHPQNDRRGLMNEITAFVLGRALGAPMADYACVAMIPLSRMKSPPPAHRGWITAALAKNPNAEYPAFCVSAVAGEDAYITWQSTGVQRFAEDLQRWPELPLAARFDQHVINTDRHLGNLRRIKKHSYRLIDHGRLVGDYGDWDIALLAARLNHMQPDNLLARAWPDGVPKATVEEILLHLDYHETAVRLALPELRQWWERIADPNDAAGFEKFLLGRAVALKQLYQSAYNQLLL